MLSLDVLLVLLSICSLIKHEKRIDKISSQLVALFPHHHSFNPPYKVLHHLSPLFQQAFFNCAIFSVLARLYNTKSRLTDLWKLSSLRARSSIMPLTFMSSGMVVGIFVSSWMRWAMRDATLRMGGQIIFHLTTMINF